MCQRVQCSAAPHIAETGVLSPLVSILSEFLLLWSQFYQSSFFSSLNFITVPSSPLSILFESLLLQVSESTVLCCSTHSRDRSSFSSGFNFIRVPSSPVSILLELLLLNSQFYQSSFSFPISGLLESLLLQVSESTVLCCSRHSRDWSSFSSGFNPIGAPSSLISILSDFLLLWSQFYQSSFFSSLNFITVPSSPLSILLESLLLQVSESTMLCCPTHSKDRSSFSSGFNFIGVPSSPLSILSQFLLLHCQSYLSPSCSKCQRVQCSAALHIAETGVLSPPVSILSEFLLLQFQFY